MRASATLFHIHPVSKMATPVTTTAAAAAAAKETFSPPVTIQRSPWHSPVPYLFGGLAAMLGLIAFALLILACSYWKLSGQANGGEDGGQRDVEGRAAEKGDGSGGAKASPAFEEKILVIMAGDVNPTFLATPTSGRAYPFNDAKINSTHKENERPKNQNQTEIRTLENGEESQESSQERIQT